MKIISKHKDYYDYYGQIYGVDNIITYYRRPTKVKDGQVEEKVYTPNENNKLLVAITLEYLQVWFCDKNYPVIRAYYKVGSWLQGNERIIEFFYHNYKDLAEEWKDICKWDSYDDSKLRNFFTSDHSYQKLNTLYGSPQIVVSGGYVEKDILMKDYKMGYSITPSQAFQRVSMFLGAKPDPIQQIPTEMHRFEAKGFDKKKSFRTRK